MNPKLPDGYDVPLYLFYQGKTRKLIVFLAHTPKPVPESRFTCFVFGHRMLLRFRLSVIGMTGIAMLPP